MKRVNLRIYKNTAEYRTGNIDIETFLVLKYCEKHNVILKTKKQCDFSFTFKCTEFKFFQVGVDLFWFSSTKKIPYGKLY